MNKKEKEHNALLERKASLLETKNSLLELEVRTNGDMLDKTLKGWGETLGFMKKEFKISILLNIAFYLAGMAAGIVLFGM